jgi:hypothetical protein
MVYGVLRRRTEDGGLDQLVLTANTDAEVTAAWRVTGNAGMGALQSIQPIGLCWQRPHGEREPGRTADLRAYSRLVYVSELTFPAVNFSLSLPPPGLHSGQWLRVRRGVYPSVDAGPTHEVAQALYLVWKRVGLLTGCI